MPSLACVNRRCIVYAAFGVVLLVAMAVALLLPGMPASADGAVTITVTASGEAVPGAFVAMVGASGRFGGVTDDGGALALYDVPGGEYVVRASASGTSVGEVAVTVPMGEPVAVTVERTGSKFRGLGAYGASVRSVVADAVSGVFYVSTESLPSVFRTGDYGGTWAPVTMANDDAEHGIDAMAEVRVLATSGFPGEVAAVTSNREGDPGDLVRLWYSRDLGVTWRCITATIPMPPDEHWQRDQLWWGHEGDTSVLFTDGPGDQMWYALMPTDAAPDREPELVQMANSYKRDASDRVTLVNGFDAPIVAVADAAGGDVTLYTVTDAPDRETAPSLTLAGHAPAAAPRFIRLGGPADGPTVGDSGNHMPRTVLAYSAEGDGAAVMSTYGEGSWVVAATAEFRQEWSDDVDPAGSFTGACAATDESNAIGSVSPLGAAGTLGRCWVTQENEELIVRPVTGINNNTGVAFDVGYDNDANRVLISGDGDFGVVKSARMDGARQRPEFPSWPTIAAAGTAPESGGISINGLDAARVLDVAYGATADEVVAATGNGRTLGSTDGGATWSTLLWRMPDNVDGQPKGTSSVSWWQGAEPGASWILAGSGGDGELLAALTTTVGLPETPVLAALRDTTAADLVAPGRDGHGVSVSALAGVPGEDIAFVGLTLQDGETYTGTLRRLRLDGTGAPTIEAAGPEVIDRAVTALAYCPAEGSHPSVADTLLVALRASEHNGSDGGIAVVKNAASGPATVTAPISGNLLEIRAHCASGVVWAGREHIVPPETPVDWVHENGLLRSTDGGATFEGVTLDVEEEVAWRMRHVSAIAIDAANAAELVVVGQGGDIISTSDGGATWTVQNDTRSMAAKHFGTTVNDIEIPPAPLEAQRRNGLRSAPAPQDALLASGSGLFSAAVRAEPEPEPDGYSLRLPCIRR